MAVEEWWAGHVHVPNLHTSWQIKVFSSAHWSKLKAMKYENYTLCVLKEKNPAPCKRILKIFGSKTAFLDTSLSKPSHPNFQSGWMKSQRFEVTFFIMILSIYLQYMYFSYPSVTTFCLSHYLFLSDKTIHYWNISPKVITSSKALNPRWVVRRKVSKWSICSFDIINICTKSNCNQNWDSYLPKVIEHLLFLKLFLSYLS